MKVRNWKTVMTVVCTLVLAFALPAGAQMQQSGAGQGPSQGGVSALSLDDGILGKIVRTNDGQSVGQIDDVIFGNRGQISNYLVDIGQGESEKTVALSPGQLRFPAQDYVVFNGTTADLMNLPEVNPYDYGVYGYYGPYGGPYGYRPYRSEGASRPYYDPYRDRYMSGAYEQGSQGQSQERQWQEPQSGQWQGRQAPPQQFPSQEYYGRGPMSMGGSPRAPQGQMQEYVSRGISGETFLSAQVFSFRHQNIGQVDDLLIDPARGRVVQAVIGLGDRKVLVPLNRLRYLGPSSVIYLGAPYQLAQMPVYRGAPAWREQRAGGSVQQGSMMQSGGSQAQPRGQQNP